MQIESAIIFVIFVVLFEYILLFKISQISHNSAVEITDNTIIINTRKLTFIILNFGILFQLNSCMKNRKIFIHNLILSNQKF